MKVFSSGFAAFEHSSRRYQGIFPGKLEIIVPKFGLTALLLQCRAFNAEGKMRFAINPVPNNSNEDGRRTWRDGRSSSLSSLAGNTGEIDANSGSIVQVTGAVTNAGTIATDDGTFKSTGGLTNDNTGIVRVEGGTAQAGGISDNKGTINLIGGTFTTENNSFSNEGVINGYGQLTTGGLTTTGRITFNGGITTVDGGLTSMKARSAPTTPQTSTRVSLSTAAASPATTPM